MKHIYIDSDQLSLKGIRALIHHYINFTHRPHSPSVSLHFIHNAQTSKKQNLLHQYRAFGVVGIEVPVKKQAADMMIIASIQEQLTNNKWQNKKSSIVLVTGDNTLFSVAELVCKRYLVALERRNQEELEQFFMALEYSCI